MSGIPPGTPIEVVNAERERIKKELELESMKSNLLYQRHYQKYMEGAPNEQVTQGQIEQTNQQVDDMTAVVRNAYSQAYALRAFREVMEGIHDGDKKREIVQQQPANSIVTNLMASGVSPEAASKWLASLTPEALGAIIALQSGNPMLAQMSYAMGQRGSGQEGLTIKDVIELNQVLRDKSPNMNIDFVKLLEVVKQQPQGMGPKEITELILTGINLANQSRPTEAPREEKRSGGILERLMETPDGIKTAKELGLIGNDTSSLQIIAEMRKNDQLLQKQIKDSDRQWDLRMEELKAKREIAQMKIQEGRERTQLISNSLQRIGKSVAEAMSGGGEQEAQTISQPIQQQQQFQCEECQGIITIPPNAVPGQTVECPKCHTKYQTTAAQPGAP